ncbi:hypothetical protein Peur_057718 [Populus x canadensis]
MLSLLSLHSNSQIHFSPFLPSLLPSSLNLFISHHFLPISQSTFTSQSHHLPPISVPTPEAGLFGVVDLKGIICKIKPRFCFFSRAADGFNVVLASPGNRICEISESSIPKD